MNTASSEREEFERFYNENFVPVMRYCTTIVKNKTDAGDIVQQVFIALWTKWTSLDFHHSARAYLYKMVYNESLNFMQRSEARRRRETRVYRMTEGVHNDKTGEKELQQMIDDAIGKLPEECRKIFRMSRNDQLKYREIAEQLGIAEKTVENQMGKALKRLREILQPFLPLIILLIELCDAQR